MDIAALSMALSQMQVKQEASVAVVKMAMEGPEAQMDKLLQGMEQSARQMEQSVVPHLGTQLDLYL